MLPSKILRHTVTPTSDRSAEGHALMGDKLSWHAVQTTLERAVLWLSWGERSSQMCTGYVVSDQTYCFSLQQRCCFILFTAAVLVSTKLFTAVCVDQGTIIQGKFRGDIWTCHCTVCHNVTI